VVILCAHPPLAVRTKRGTREERSQLQLVVDRIALMDVMLKYAKGVDERDMALYRSVFADDVQIVGFVRTEIRGAAAWMTFVEQALAQYGATQHMLARNSPRWTATPRTAAPTGAALHEGQTEHDADALATYESECSASTVIEDRPPPPGSARHTRPVRLN
jgi:hypothetical protein